MSNLVCYTIGYSYVTSSNQYFPCGSSNGTSGAQSCCYAGDYCMEGSICHYTHEVTNGTGYYMAGCTDPTWQDPACPKQCISEYGADIVYDSSASHWDCCISSAGFLDCQQPSDHIVNASSPNDLSTMEQITASVPSVVTTAIGPVTLSTSSSSTTSPSSSTPTTSSSSTSSTSTATESPSPPPSSTMHSSSTGLSGGAKAGIAVACVVAAISILGAAFFLYRRRHRTKGYLSSTHPTYEMDSREASIPKPPIYGAKYEGARSELDAGSRAGDERTDGDKEWPLPGSVGNPQELEGQRGLVELPGHGREEGEGEREE